MKVAFDQQVFTLQRYGGISRYICSLAKHQNEISDIEARVFAPFYINKNLCDIEGVPHRGVFLRSMNSKLLRAANLANDLLVGVAGRRFAPDIIHETYFDDRIRLQGSAARVATVYDMIHERFADRFDNAHITTEAKRATVERADHVICISKSTQNDLVELFDIPIGKTSVVYLSTDQMFESRVAVENYTDSRPYLLYVGARSTYKNFNGLLRAYGSSPKLNAEFDLLCFGGGEFTPEERSLIEDTGVPLSRVRSVQGDDGVLRQHYANAHAFVYPSQYEGFGIPPLEAMAQGCPVICSNTSSIPEIVGEAAEYFEPDRTDSISAAIENVVFSQSRIDELKSRGEERRKKFSWQICAAETTAIYRKLK